MTSGRLDSESWRRVNELFHQALDLAAADRATFVEHECGGAGAVRDEVLSLLAAHDRTDQFLAQPVASVGSLRAPAADAAARRVGQQIGQYRIDRILGEGGMGVVYQVEDLRLGRTVALKAISPDVTRDPARRERLRREARAAAALTHPGIATVYALEEFGDDIFIAGEFIAGETLREEVSRGPVEPARVLETALELAHALSAAHDRGVIHRDLKPENVIRTPSGRVKILDFGLARLREVPPDLAQLTDDGRVFGTPAYMSPEQIRREPVDARADLFSLGIVLYELLTGENPFGRADPAATIARILQSEPPPFASGGSSSRASGNLRQGLEGIVRTLLQKAPAARFTSAHELAAALDRVRSGEVIVPESGPVAAPAEALWWWKFHQAATSTFYVLLLIPAGLVLQTLDNDRVGVPMFLVAAVAVVASTTLRMHLWFASAAMPHAWDDQHARTWKWLRAADVLLVLALIAIGIVVLQGNKYTASALIIAGVLALVSATVIEPATTRAAFGPSSRNDRAD